MSAFVTASRSAKLIAMLMRRMENRVLSRARKIFVLSRYSADQISGVHHLPQEQVVMIPAGIELEPFRLPETGKSEVKQALEGNFPKVASTSSEGAIRAHDDDAAVTPAGEQGHELDKDQMQLLEGVQQELMDAKGAKKAKDVQAYRVYSILIDEKGCEYLLLNHGLCQAYRLSLPEGMGGIADVFDVRENPDLKNYCGTGKRKYCPFDRH
jgi:hypothetical protein